MGLIKPSSQGTLDLSSITDKLTSMQEDISGLETTASGIVTSVGEVKTSVDSIQTSGGGTISTDLTALTEKIDSVGNNVLELLSKGGAAIKSIQRGYDLGNNNNLIEITINPINPDKSFVILNAEFISCSEKDYGMIWGPVLISLTENKLVISPVISYSGTRYVNQGFSWQVIEFY